MPIHVFADPDASACDRLHAYARTLPCVPPSCEDTSFITHFTGGGASKTRREEIDIRVNSWRASATFKTNLLASTGQVSLDPANMLNTLPLDLVDDDEVQ